jgi:zinc protease
MWVKTGSIDEKKGEEGISHFIEHLVFKGTRRFGVGEIASVVEGSGGELNAYTSFDQTVFYVTISKQFSNVALDVISEMMGFPTFDPVEIDNEREVVIEEIKRGQDSPQRRASQLLFSTVFKKSGYGRPVIGYDKVVRGVSAKKIREYYQSRYVPRNMFLVIAGDFDSSEMKKKVTERFGEFVDYRLRASKHVKEPKQKTVRIAVEESQFEQTMGYLTWRIPGVTHKDIAALEVFSMILGQGDSSRLTKALRIDKPLTNGVGSFAYSMQDEGVFAVSFSLQKENLTEALQTLLQELSKTLQAPPSNQELQKAVTNIASQEVYSLETVDNIARKAGSHEFYFKDHEHFKKYLKQVYALKPEDILKVARKYLTKDGFSLSLLSNQTKKESEKILKDFGAKLKKTFAAAKVEKRKPVRFAAKKISFGKTEMKEVPVTEKIILKSGATVLIREQKDTPYVSVRAALMGGVRMEPKGKEGLIELFSRNWMSGTKNFSEEKINEISDEMAAGIGAFGGRNSVGLSMECLNPAQERMYEIFADALLHPTFPAEILEREKIVMLNQLKARNDNPSQICILNFMKKIYAGHPYALDMLGTEASIRGITQKDLLDYYRNVTQAKNLTICIVGDVDKKKWIERLEKLTAGLPQGKRLSQTFAIDAITTESLEKVILKKEQTHIVVGYRGLTLTDPERYTLEIIQSILSGQGGRLFIELRDKNSLAYSVSPIHMEGIECGYFGGYIGCSPEKTDKSIQMLKSEFKKLADQKISKEELERAQRYLVGRHDIELQRKSSICSSLLFDDIYGIDYRESLDVADKYFAVTPEQVQKLAQKIFSQPAVISIVGP